LGGAESPDAICNLANELREHPERVALKIQDEFDRSAREWKIQHTHSLEEKERQLRRSGRSAEAESARRQKEALELPKARLALVVDQLEELFTSGFLPEVREKYISAVARLVQSGRVFAMATLRSDFYASYQELAAPLLEGLREKHPSRTSRGKEREVFTLRLPYSCSQRPKTRELSPTATVPPPPQRLVAPVPWNLTHFQGNQ
jgi:hypothetical protein